MGRMKDTTIPDFDPNSHYLECPMTSFDPVCDDKDCTCQCDLIARVRVDAIDMAVGMAFLRYLQTHTRNDTLKYLEEGGM